MSLAHELWPGIKFSPTLTHSFLALLSQKGLLLRNYTQNIDGLEFLAGIPDDKLVECHGHFRTSACVDCKAAAEPDLVKKTIVEDRETPICKRCGGNIKPDIGTGSKGEIPYAIFVRITFHYPCLDTNQSLSFLPSSLQCSSEKAFRLDSRDC